MRGAKCGDIDVVIELKREWQPLFSWHERWSNYDRALIELRRGLKRVEFHYPDDLDRFVGTPLMGLI